jgi:hypothetical protein
MSSKKQEIAPSQHDRFVDVARALGCDEDKEKFEATLGKIAAHKPSKDKAMKRPLKGRSAR